MALTFRKTRAFPPLNPSAQLPFPKYPILGGLGGGGGTHSVDRNQCSTLDLYPKMCSQVHVQYYRLQPYELEKTYKPS